MGWLVEHRDRRGSSSRIGSTILDAASHLRPVSPTLALVLLFSQVQVWTGVGQGDGQGLGGGQRKDAFLNVCFSAQPLVHTMTQPTRQLWQALLLEELVSWDEGCFVTCCCSGPSAYAFIMQLPNGDVGGV